MNLLYKIIKNDFYLIDDPIPHSAAFNMEFDTWLFQLLEAGYLQRAVRFYTWKKPSITYGKFQKPDKDIDLVNCQEDNIEMVKRPTGGRAILHFNELTFSLVFNSETISEYNFRNSFLFIADLIIYSLQKIRISARINQKPQHYENSSLCFHSVSQYEVIDQAGVKVAGIAQLFNRKGVLIQGSIPLEQDPQYQRYFLDKNFSPLLNEIIINKTEFNQLHQALGDGFREKLNISSWIS